MNMRVAVVLLAMVGSACAADLAVDLTVSEPAGVARKASPACGGVPFPQGAVKDVAELALFDSAGKSVPAQFSKLAGYDDGSVQWTLVDTLVDLPANGVAKFTVKKGESAVAAVALKITETDDRVTIDSGAATFVVNKANFNVLDSVTIGGKAVAGPGEAAVTDAEGKVYKAGKPTRVNWEYRGPIRSTLRVDGPFLNGDEEYTSYTTRLTFWAGSPVVRISQSLRNSHPTAGFDAKLKSATVSLKLLNAETARLTGADYFAAGNVLVTDRHTAGCFPAGPPGTGSSASKRNPPNIHQASVAAGLATVYVVPEATESNAKLIGYGITKEPEKPADPKARPAPMKRPFVATGEHASKPGLPHFALADLAHKDSDIWFDFAVAGDEAAAKARRAELHSLPHVLADGAWISQTDALGVGRFGTFADEVATYKAWGWKGADDEKKQAAARSESEPDAFVSKVDIHDESESDSVELFSLMYVRTGQRGFLDQAAAYAGYYKGHAVWRTDGFVYDGFRNERSGVVAKSKRKSTGLSHGWYGPVEYGWNDSRFHMCHQWATGLIDYYCLTGDTDALEAGLDWAEYASATYYDQKVGSPHKWGRAWGRSFGIIIRAWQVTRDAKWKALADSYAQIAIKAPNRRDDGLFADEHSSMVPYFTRDVLESKKSPMPPRLKAFVDEHGLTWKNDRGRLVFTDKTGKSWPMMTTSQSFEYEACDAAVARYAELTGDADAKKLLVDMARCAEKYFWSTKCEHLISHPYIGFPEDGKVYDPGFWAESHKNCPGPDGGVHNGYHDRFFADIFARAYAASGDKQWLDWAKRVWNRGSKRGYQTTSQNCPDDEVKQFVGHFAPKGDSIDIRNSMRMFYEVPRVK